MVMEIAAPVKTVWEVLMDPSYVPKLYKDVLTVEVNPPGRGTVGQKFHIVGKAGRRKLEIFAETTELVTEKRIVATNVPGGLFRSFSSLILLDAKGGATEVKTTFEYELSMGYLGKVFNMVLLERLVMDNLKSYTHNLKEICELLPLPS
jgi:uncharacterized membrane protein